ncbi:MAG: SUMF1/EgtB/PvdO family nonheme iron enzyme [Actinobacteria bacterium]|nr:SUMF1/EgtB/PvdO family nonheme iron enzyme [Actinomycetota bacterium]
MQLGETPFPVFIRLSELAEHILRQEVAGKVRWEKESPQWLAHYMAAKSKSLNWGLEESFFQELFGRHDGKTLFLLDGLDEAPNRETRVFVSSLVTNAVHAFAGNLFVVTSRPQAYRGKVMLADAERFTILPLEDEGMKYFLSKWLEALHSGNSEGARAHMKELLGDLRSRPEIYNMVRNPVMLTALAVVHWNEKRLPEQRADLYESIITWLLRAREKRPDRLPAEECGRKMQKLALGLHRQKGGRRVQFSRRQGAEILKDDFPGETEEQRIFRAEKFLEEEEVDSGIVVSRGSQLTFWHLTFQEYLAARALGGKTDDEQLKMLVRPGVLHNAEWRETLLLFGGVLHAQGPEKVDNFFKAILDTTPADAPLAEQARCVGLIDAMLHDLQSQKYEIKYRRYHDMLHRVMAIFDKNKAKELTPEERNEAAEALGRAGDPRLGLEKPERWVSIAEGRFLMGAQKSNKGGPNYDRDAQDRETPHWVELSAFQISKYPVTVMEFRQFVDAEGYAQKRYWRAGGWGLKSEPQDWAEQKEHLNRPIVSVCWYEAMAFCAWLSEHLGQTVTLPTEAQWERAARGPGDYRIYPWGNKPPDGRNCNSSKSKIGHASPVGLFPQDTTDEGVVDMGGNVYEWCLDAYKEDFYKMEQAQGVDPAYLPDRAENRADNVKSVVRGGSWFVNDGAGFRCADRDRGNPDYWFYVIGFRVARSAQS